MRRIFWDTMLLVYLLEGHPAYSERVNQLLQLSYERKDKLVTSCLDVGELLTGSSLRVSSKAAALQANLDDAGFGYLPFEFKALELFAELRRQKVKVADAVHLASAAAAGVDLFMTGDRQLHKLHVPGIRFIADFNNPILY